MGSRISSGPGSICTAPVSLPQQAQHLGRHEQRTSMLQMPEGGAGRHARLAPHSRGDLRRTVNKSLSFRWRQVVRTGLDGRAPPGPRRRRIVWLQRARVRWVPSISASAGSNPSSVRSSVPEFPPRHLRLGTSSIPQSIQAIMQHGKSAKSFIGVQSHQNCLAAAV